MVKALWVFNPTQVSCFEKPYGFAGK